MTGWTFEISARSRAVELGFILSDAMPRVPNVPPYVVATGAAHDDIRLDDGTSGCNEILLLGTHMGTHLDGLAHASADGRVHGGIPVEQIQTRTGVRELDMTTVPPFVLPGFLLDLVAHRGSTVTQTALELTSSDLEPLADLPLGGAVVLIRTGWGSAWRAEPDRYASRDEARPGLGSQGAQWLADRGVRAVGTDSFTIESWMPQRPPEMPAHKALLVDRGIFIFEALDLEELASLAPSQFLFVALPLRLAGASGSPIRPIAIVTASDSSDDAAGSLAAVRKDHVDAI